MRDARAQAPAAQPAPVEARFDPGHARVAAPAPAAPSGVLYRVGMKSDLTEFVAGTAGTIWVVASGDRAELVQGPVTLRPEGAAAAGFFQVQAGAFSQEEPAKKQAERLGASLQSSTQIAFSADRGLYRVLLGAFPTRAEADAFLAKLKASGHDGFVVPGAPVTSAAAATISVTGGQAPR